MDIIAMYEMAIESLEQVGPAVKGGEETNPSAVSKSTVRCRMRWVAKHQSWKVSVKTDKPWGNRVSAKDIASTTYMFVPVVYDYPFCGRI